jgi:hypothetical protein
MSTMRRSRFGNLASRAIARASLGRVLPLLLVCLLVLLLVPDGRAAAPADAGRAFGSIQAASPDASEPALRPAAVALDAEEVAGDPWQGSSTHVDPSNLDTGRRLIRRQADLRANAGRHVPERPPRLPA